MSSFSRIIADSDTIALVRSAHIGDFLVCIPLIERLMCKTGIKVENIYFIIINDSGTDPVRTSFGDNYFPDEHIFIVNSAPSKIVSEIRRVRKAIGDRIDHLLYLPFYTESPSSILKKTLFLKSIFGISKSVQGTYLKDGVVSNSQYFSLLERYGYEFDRSVNYVQFLGVDSCQTRKWIDDLLILDGPKAFAVYPHSKLEMKIWPKIRYESLIRELHARYAPVFYLIGSKDDETYNQSIIDSLQEVTIFNIAGSLSVREMIFFLSKMDIVIGNDGAPLHMAALANAPIVGIYTYKAPLGMWDPVVSKRMTTIRKDIVCRECYRKECNDPDCIRSISVEDVMREVDSIFKTADNTFVTIKAI